MRSMSKILLALVMISAIQSRANEIQFNEQAQLLVELFSQQGSGFDELQKTIVGKTDSFFQCTVTITDARDMVKSRIFHQARNSVPKVQIHVAIEKYFNGKTFSLEKNSVIESFSQDNGSNCSTLKMSVNNRASSGEGVLQQALIVLYSHTSHKIESVTVVESGNKSLTCRL